MAVEPTVRTVPVLEPWREAPASDLDSATPLDVDAGSQAQPEVLIGTEPLEDPETSLTTRSALEGALEGVSEGLRLYQAGDHEAARHSLNDARILLLQADLPEALQEQGLSLLHCALSDELRHHDLEAVAEILELESRPADELVERELIEREVNRILRRFGAP